MAVTKIPKKTVTLIEPKKSFIVDKAQHRQKRVAAYCRVSTDSEEQLTSYTNQMKVYTEMIAANKEWEFAGLYADEGISGTRADKRPQFQKMIEDCFKGKIDMIITKSVSRFARNTVDCLDYVRSLKEIGVGIYFEEQNIDTLKSDSELYLIIYAGFAQSESESISKNITWTQRKKFEDGKVTFMYSRTIGYKKGEDGNPEIVPEEAVIVQRVFDMYLSGKSTDEISEILQSEDIVIPEKKLNFSKSMIIRMLKNEKYCGDAILQKTVTIDPISKKRKVNEGEAPMWLVENSHPAIITREVFNKVQEESARRKAKAPQSEKTALTASGKHSKYALTEVMMCGECGSRFKRVTWNIRGKRRIVWRCISRLDFGKKYCHQSPTMDEKPLQDAIMQAVMKVVQTNPHVLQTLKMHIQMGLGGEAGEDESMDIQIRIAQIDKKFKDILNSVTAENQQSLLVDPRIGELMSEKRILENRLAEYAAAEQKRADTESRLANLYTILEGMKNHPMEYDDRMIRKILRCVVVQTKQRIKVIFIDGLEMEVEVEQ